ncbi:MAG: fused MFS/spermidine synthase, partial [Actinomycetota bacterium]|nr:fused MFS/spermidine synthase [Actinomycetota bacterium]
MPRDAGSGGYLGAAAVSTRAAAALVFCTSAAVLVLEILAGRLVAPYVGVSIETFTGVIGTVLAG